MPFACNRHRGGCRRIHRDRPSGVFAYHRREAGRVAATGVEHQLVVARRCEQAWCKVAAVVGAEAAAGNVGTVWLVQLHRHGAARRREAQARDAQTIAFACLGREGVLRVASCTQIDGAARAIYRQGAGDITHQ